MLGWKRRVDLRVESTLNIVVWTLFGGKGSQLHWVLCFASTWVQDKNNIDVTHRNSQKCIFSKLTFEESNRKTLFYIYDNTSGSVNAMLMLVTLIHNHQTIHELLLDHPIRAYSAQHCVSVACHLLISLIWLVAINTVTPVCPLPQHDRPTE